MAPFPEAPHEDPLYGRVGEARSVEGDEVGGFGVFVGRVDIELGDLDRKLELRQRVECFLYVRCVYPAAEVPLHADPADRSPGRNEFFDMPGVLRPVSPADDGVVVDVEDRLGVRAASPLEHLDADPLAQAPGVVIRVDHFVVHIVLDHLAAIAFQQSVGANFQSAAQFLVVQRLDPRLDVFVGSPENAVSADSQSVGAAPCDHAIGVGVVGRTCLTLRSVPLHRIFADGGVEVGLEYLQVLLRLAR